MTRRTDLRFAGRLEVMRLMTARARKPFRVSTVVSSRDLRMACRASDGFLIDILSVRLMTAHTVGMSTVRNLNA
jgi:hypothetical protein